jgi:hypothetical protein
MLSVTQDVQIWSNDSKSSRRDVYGAFAFAAVLVDVDARSEVPTEDSEWT